MRILLFVFILASCGNSGTDPVLNQKEEPLNPPPVSEINPADLNKIANLLPTMYYTAEEDKTNCKGKYGNVTYNGTETTDIISVDERVMATVCTRFYKVLLMEGSAILKDRGQGKVGINYGFKIGEERRYRYLERCVFGEGVEKDLCLLPYHTIASDNKVHAIGEIIFVPKAVGLKLPDGSTHEGYFIVRDTGSAFTGIGAQRIDLFTGLDPDNDNTFSRAGFSHNTPMEAFKVTGPSAEVVKERLKAKFGEIY